MFLGCAIGPAQRRNISTATIFWPLGLCCVPYGGPAQCTCDYLRVLAVQTLMLWGLPLTMSWWFVEEAHCHAPPVGVPLPTETLPKRDSLILRAIDVVSPGAVGQRHALLSSFVDVCRERYSLSPRRASIHAGHSIAGATSSPQQQRTTAGVQPPASGTPNQFAMTPLLLLR